MLKIILSGVVLWMLVASIALGGCESIEPPTSESKTAVAMETASCTWRMMLDCALSETDLCDSLLEYCKNESDAPVGVLAGALIEERSWESDDERLERPRLVYIDLPATEDLEAALGSKVTWSVVVLVGEVQLEGTVSNPRFLRESESSELNEIIMSAFAGALFRPALRRGNFVPMEVTYVYKLEPE
jgi:hypothetical protein